MLMIPKRPNPPVVIEPYYTNQIYTPNGYFLDEVKSALQKCVRLCYVNDALFWGTELYNMGGPYRTTLINRIVVIMSEDIGVANIFLPNYVMMMLIKYKKYKDHKPMKAKSIILRLIKYLAISPKDRCGDNLIAYVMGDPSKKKKKLNYVPKYILCSSIRSMKGSNETNSDYLSFLNGFLWGMDHKNEREIAYWIQKIFDITRPCRYGASSPLGRTIKDFIYPIWKIIIKSARKRIRKYILPLLLRQRYMNVFLNLFACYHKYKNGERERLWIIHAVILYCRLPSLYNTYDESKYGDFIIQSKIKKEELKRHVTIPMMDVAIDKHTKRGRIILKRGVYHFFSIGTIINNVPNYLTNDKNKKHAIDICIQRSKEHIQWRPRLGKVKNLVPRQPTIKRRQIIQISKHQKNNKNKHSKSKIKKRKKII